MCYFNRPNLQIFQHLTPWLEIAHRRTNVTAAEISVPTMTPSTRIYLRTLQLVIAFGLIGCTPSEDTNSALPEVGASVSEDGDAIRIVLAESPTALALRSPPGFERPSTVSRVPLPDSVAKGHVADIAPLPGGAIAVLLRDLKSVAVVGDGKVERWIGREGRGPGEFRNPLALEAASNGLAVLDELGIHVFDSTGRPLTPVRLPWLPDWSLTSNRRPLLYHQAPYQMGPEDVTRRLFRMPGGYGALAGERSQSLRLPEDGSPQRLSLEVLSIADAGGAAESVGTLTGPLRRSWTVAVPVRDLLPILVEPLFERRPLAAGSNEWFASFDPARDEVRVSFKDGTRPTLISWAPEQAALNDSMRVQFIERHMADFVNAATNDSIARTWERRAAHASFAEKLRQSREIEFSDSIAPIAAMFSQDGCLWMVGMDARDFTDGTSHWGVQVDVRRATVRGPIRLARRGTRLLSVGHTFAYSLSRNWDGEFQLERTPLPDCTT